MPRMQFLKEKANRSGAVWGLNLILTPSDDAFASKVPPTRLSPPFSPLDC